MTEVNSSNMFLNANCVDDYIKDTMLSLRECLKFSSELQGWQHYKDYSAMQPTMDQVNLRLKTLITSIFSHSDIKLKLSQHRLIDQFDMVREGNDSLLERTNSIVDDAAGLKKQPALNFVDSTIKTVERPIDKTGRSVVLMAARNTQKPQLFFSQKINNSSKEPFIPLLKEKPNSMKPLAMILSIDDNDKEFFDHPYKYELDHWSPLPHQLEVGSITESLTMDKTPLCKVETEEALIDMVDKLKKCTEISVDLEHHNFRSYLGLTCLMQISTRTEDYIVDTLSLRGKLCLLNDVFTDPKIIKVFHGADFDILWLQRDCGVYVVNMFDTHQAAVILQYPQKSLSALLHRFCGVQANKVYQRADWRTRPLPIDFIDYARQDTHYLLFIYDHLRKQLIERGNNLNNLIDTLYSRSKDLCLQRYEKPIIDSESHMMMYRKSRKSFNKRQIFALQKLYQWRDSVAREHDESVDFVLPKHMLLQISEVLPKEMQGILACCNPIPPLVKTELLTLHNIIRSAREQCLTKDDLKPKYPLEVQNLEDQSQSVISQHDLSQIEDNVSGLPCILDKQNPITINQSKDLAPIQIKKTSKLFGCISTKTRAVKYVSSKTDEFISPYYRHMTYLKLKPMLEGEHKRKIKSGDVERIIRIKDHLSNILSNSQEEVTSDHNSENSEEMNTPTVNAPSSIEENEDRIKGLFQYLKKINDATEDLNPTPSESKVETTAKTSAQNKMISEVDEDAEKVKIITRQNQRKNNLESMSNSEESGMIGETIENKGDKSNVSNISGVSEAYSKVNKVKSQSTDGLAILGLQENTINSLPKKKKKKKKNNPKKTTKNTVMQSDNLETCEKEINNVIIKKEKVSIKTENDDSLENQNIDVPEKNTTEIENSDIIKKETTEIKMETKRKSSEMEEDLDSTENEASTNDENSKDTKEFDYNTADFSIFEKKAKSSKRQKIDENFKAGSQKSKMKKKSGMKSFTWGGGRGRGGKSNKVKKGRYF